MDPPYGDVGRASFYGRHESFTVAEEVRAWCLTVGDNPLWRIVYAGFEGEGGDLLAAGWREVEWYSAGHLKGGMGNVGGTGKHQQHRERALVLSALHWICYDQRARTTVAVRVKGFSCSH